MNGGKCLLDTNIVIGFLKGNDTIVDFFRRRLSKRKLYASCITRMELMSFPDLSSEEGDLVRKFLSNVTVVGIGKEVEDRAIAVRRAHRLKLPDAIIVASAMESGCILVTSDSAMLGKSIEGCPMWDPTRNSPASA